MSATPSRGLFAPNRGCFPYKPRAWFPARRALLGTPAAPGGGEAAKAARGQSALRRLRVGRGGLGGGIREQHSLPGGGGRRALGQQDRAFSGESPTHPPKELRSAQTKSSSHDTAETTVGDGAGVQTPWTPGCRRPQGAGCSRPPPRRCPPEASGPPRAAPPPPAARASRAATVTPRGLARTGRARALTPAGPATWSPPRSPHPARPRFGR